MGCFQFFDVRSLFKVTGIYISRACLSVLSILGPGSVLLLMVDLKAKWALKVSAISEGSLITSLLSMRGVETCKGLGQN